MPYNQTFRDVLHFFQRGSGPAAARRTGHYARRHAVANVEPVGNCARQHERPVFEQGTETVRSPMRQRPPSVGNGY